MAAGSGARFRSRPRSNPSGLRPIHQPSEAAARVDADTLFWRSRADRGHDADFEDEMPSQAVIYYTHFVSDPVKRELAKLVRELGSAFDLHAVGCCERNSTLDDLRNENIKVSAYTRADLRVLPYARKLASVDWNTLRYSADLCLMRFYRAHPDYDYYWIIEYDVRYTGNWSELFADLAASPADLLCEHVTTFKQSPNWGHWPSFSAGDDAVTEDGLIRGFLPFSRLSRKLMQAIDDRCSRGWTGQYEALWPTIAQAAGATIEEIGGESKLVPASRRGKYYHSVFWPSGLFLSTMVAWPSFSEKSNFNAASPPNLLWHPVKE